MEYANLKHSNETFWVSFKHCAKCKIETFLTLCLNLILKNSSWILKMKSFTDLFTKSSVQNVNNLFTSFFQKVFAVNFVACFFYPFCSVSRAKVTVDDLSSPLPIPSEEKVVVIDVVSVVTPPSALPSAAAFEEVFLMTFLTFLTLVVVVSDMVFA